VKWPKGATAAPGALESSPAFGARFRRDASHFDVNGNGSIIHIPRRYRCDRRRPYAEYEGDRSTISSSTRTDVAVLREAEEHVVPPVVVAVLGPPARLIGAGRRREGFVSRCPGSEGAGVADVLFGVARPPLAACLSQWLQNAAHEPIN